MESISKQVAELQREVVDVNIKTTDFFYIINSRIESINKHLAESEKEGTARNKPRFIKD